MTADPETPGPQRLLHEMTDRELSRIRYQLTRALQDMTATDPARPALQQQLTAVRVILQAHAGAQPGRPADAQPGTYDLTARTFVGLFTDYDLHDLPAGYIALPKGTPVFAGASLGELARQISIASSYEQPRPAQR
jgi:hypothetical protein